MVLTCAAFNKPHLRPDPEDGDVGNEDEDRDEDDEPIGTTENTSRPTTSPASCGARPRRERAWVEQKLMGQGGVWDDGEEEEEEEELWEGSLRSRSRVRRRRGGEGVGVAAGRRKGDPGLAVVGRWKGDPGLFVVAGR